MNTEILLEQHFTVSQLASLWAVSEDTIRRLFQNDPSVLHLGHRARRGKGRYVTLRIPKSVAERVRAGLNRIAA